MFKKANRKEARERRHLRVRKRVFGTPERPRLFVYRSEKNIHTQIIDDVNVVTLVVASSLDKAIEVKGSSKEAAKLVGELVARRAIEKGINDVIFDRGEYVYHGRAEALASGVREARLKFQSMRRGNT